MIRSAARRLLRVRSSAPPPPPPPPQYTEEEKLKLRRTIQLRKIQLEKHLNNLRTIWKFFEFLVTFSTKFSTFISAHYKYENKDHILTTIPMVPDIITHTLFYDSYVDNLHDIGEKLTNTNTDDNIYAMTYIKRLCAEANDKWHDNYNYYLLKFGKKIKYIETMFAELQKNINKRELATSIADELHRELILTKGKVDNLLFMYFSQEFNFEFFEEVLLSIIKKLEPDQPTSAFMYHPEGSVYKTPYKGSETSGITYIGPGSMQTQAKQQSSFTEFPPGYMGGIKRHNSKLYTYKYYNKAFNTNSKKTFRKKRNYKKTKRRKY